MRFFYTNIIFTAILIISILLTSCGVKDDVSEISLTAHEIAESVLSSTEFPKMKELFDKDEMEKYIGINFDYVEDVCFYWQMISVELAEVLIIIPKEGREQDALDFADERRLKISTDTAFYPSQEAAANASVSGIKNNVVYFICGNEAGKAEEFLLELLG